MRSPAAGLGALMVAAACGVYGNHVDPERVHLGMSPAALEAAVGAPYRRSEDGSVWVYRRMKVTMFDSWRVDTILWFRHRRLARMCRYAQDPRFRLIWHIYELRPKGASWVAERVPKQEAREIVRELLRLAPNLAVFEDGAPEKVESRFFW